MAGPLVPPCRSARPSLNVPRSIRRMQAGHCADLLLRVHDRLYSWVSCRLGLDKAVRSLLKEEGRRPLYPYGSFSKPSQVLEHAVERMIGRHAFAAWRDMRPAKEDVCPRTPHVSDRRLRSRPSRQLTRPSPAWRSPLAEPAAVSVHRRFLGRRVAKPIWQRAPQAHRRTPETGLAHAGNLVVAKMLQSTFGSSACSKPEAREPIPIH